MPATNAPPLWALAGRKRHAAARHDEQAAEYRRQAEELERLTREQDERSQALSA